MLSGTGSEKFSISNSGVVTLSSALDYESTTEFTLVATVTNDAGESAGVDVTINVSDIDERNALSTQIARVLPSNHFEDQYFGSSSDVDGEYVVVGSDSESFAYVFKREEDDTFSELVKFRGDDTIESDEFGMRVAIEGTTVVVSAPSSMDGGEFYGSLYIFDFDKGTNDITQREKISVIDDNSALFGMSMALKENYLVVGAPARDEGGRVYVYDISGATATLIDSVISSDLTTQDRFGQSVALDGKNVVVGANKKDIDSLAYVGSAYLFRIADDNTSVTQKTIIVADDREAGDQFATSVALSGSYVVVGSQFDDDGGELNSGSIYAYKIAADNSSVTSLGKLSSTLPAAFEFFGSSVAMDANRFVVGGANEESLYVYDINESDDIEFVQKLQANITENGSSFAYSVAIDGSTILATAQSESIEHSNGGALYIFDDRVLDKVYEYSSQDTLSVVENTVGVIYCLDMSTPNEPLNFTLGGVDSAHFTLEENNLSIPSGLNFESPSDDDSDGVYALIITAEDAKGNTKVVTMDVNITDEFVVALDKASTSDEAVGDKLGQSVDVSGEYVVVGSPFSDVGATDGGRVKLYKRNGDKIDLLASFTSSDVAENDHFGKSVSIVDEYIVVGAPGDVPRGAVYIYKRNGDLTPTIVGKFTPVDTSDLDFGNVISMAKNITTPTQYDFVVGTSTNSVEILTIDSTDDSVGRVIRLADPYFIDYGDGDFGASVAINDNRILVGAPLRTVDGKTAAGAVYKYGIGKDNWEKLVNITKVDATADDNFGSSVAVADNFVAIASLGDGESGSVTVYEDVDGFEVNIIETLVASDATSNIRYGSSIAMSDSILSVGAMYDDEGRTNSGSVYFYSIDALGSVAFTQKVSQEASAAQMGSSLAVDAQSIVVGSPGEESGKGAVDLYIRELN